ncbi:MAG: PIG-L deacetylase family protein, partial [Nitriliruptoraceae bacterium]
MSDRGDPLPATRRALAVCAHPDDETFGLGGLISSYVHHGAEMALLTLTRGEASTLGADAQLAERRTAELACAARRLGVATTWLRDHPDGHLADVAMDQLVAEVQVAIERHHPELLLVFHPSGITGHPDHQRATEAALLAACGADLPVYGWFVPSDVAVTLNAEFGTGFVPTEPTAEDRRVPVDRAAQRAACACHRSQSGALPLIERKLELLGEFEHLRPLTRTAERAVARSAADQ